MGLDDNDNFAAKPTITDTNPATTSFRIATQFTFTQIIDADHFTIQNLAKRIRRLLTSAESPNSPSDGSPSLDLNASTISTTLTHLRPLLLEATWRLIRHDFSEEVVMRPAFEEVLGQEGRRMAEHDRSDHASGRQALLTILSKLESLESTIEIVEKSTNARSAVPIEEQLREILRLVTETFDDLGKHMAVESGQFLPYFESIIDDHLSRRLARDYAGTLVMAPHVKVGNRLIFPSGIPQYVKTDLDRMKQLYEEVLQQSKIDSERYVSQMMIKEIEYLQVGKWLGMNERKALRESGSVFENERSGKGKL